ncbi:MAG: ATPase, T2SS/T4P/T4SS family [Burkholderiaceae bacterium]
MLTLSIESEDSRPLLVQVDTFPCRIGRRRGNEIVLPSWRVARVHARIVRQDRGYKLIDGGSILGTWVNGERIVEYGPLDHSDEIAIAGFKLHLEANLRESATDPGGATTAAEAGAPFGAAVDEVSSAGSTGGSQDAGRGPLERSSIEWRRTMHRKLLHAIDLRRKDVRQLTQSQLRAETRALLVELLAEESDLPDATSVEPLIEEVLDEAIGLGPLERLMADAEVSEVMVNGAQEIFVERRGKLERSAASFTSDDAIRAVIDRIVSPLGRRIDEASPMVDARLPDGSRVNAIVPPLALKGPSITIRRFNRRLLRPNDLVRLGTASPEMIRFIEVCVRHRKNIVISGGTGSGKTTLLNVVSNLIPPAERVVTIEDAAELRLDHENLVSLESRPANAEGRGAVTIRDLVRNALRMRPDRIVVGECRGGEALDMLQAMNTGHDGSLTTLHANSPRDVIARLETLVLMSGVDLPVAAIRDQVASAVDVIIHQARLADGSRRITEIVEVSGVEAQRVQMQSLFRWMRDGTQGWRFAACGVVPQFYESLDTGDVPPDLSIFVGRAAREPGGA